jgi:DNA-binding transcriptional LysR family regulator
MRRKIPSTQALMCFESAARHESYTRAAQELALTQSAVSRQIGALEAFLDTPLFRRTRHGVALTARGATYARQIARRLDAMEHDTLEAMSGPGAGGVLALAAVPSFATEWLIPRLPDLRARHPDIEVHIETRTRPFLFADCEFDAAIQAASEEQLRNWPGTQATRLLAEEVLPVCCPQMLAGRQRLSPKAMAQLPLLQQSTRPYDWRQWFDEQGVAAAHSLSGPRYELFSMLAMAAAHGLGLALVPRLLIAGELARGELVVACDKPLRGLRSYYLVSPEQGDERALLTRFRAWLLAQAAQSALG